MNGMPSGLIQPQGSWNVGAILEPHFATLNYLLPPQVLNPGADKTFTDNRTLWTAIIEEKLRAHRTIILEGFYLFEWFPRTPGLYYTPEAEWVRTSALEHLDPHFRSTPSNPPIDHAGTLVQGSRRSSVPQDHTLVFTPEGKLSMLQGGVGCIRLKPIQQNERVFWLMSASANGVAHEGFPLAVPQQLYETCIDQISERGMMFCTIIGKLKYLPQPFTGLFDYYAGVPPLYLDVAEIRPNPFLRTENASATEVSVAVSFLSDYQRPNGIYASYVTFSPGRKASFSESINWLKHEYIEGTYKGRILTDFDQTKNHFPEAALSLRKVMGRHLRQGEVREVIELMYAAGDVDGLFNKLDLQDLANNRAGVARTKVFVSYSHTDKRWLERVKVHLKPLIREQGIDIWDDSRIEAGSMWQEELESAIESAQVAILLISADFYASDFIAEVELPKLLAAAESKGAIILPVILSPSRYPGDPQLNRFQAVNDPGKPIVQLSRGRQEQIFEKLGQVVQRALNHA
jgi:TIR domain-containing protein